MRTLYYGAGLALIVGLAVGMTLRPELSAEAPPAAAAPPSGAADAPAAWPPVAMDEASGFADDPSEVPAYVQATAPKKVTASIPAVPKAGTAAASPSGVPESVLAALAGASEPSSEQTATPDGQGYYVSPIQEDQPIATAAGERHRKRGHLAMSDQAEPSAEAGTATDAAAQAELPPVALSTEGHDETPMEATGDTRVEH